MPLMIEGGRVPPRWDERNSLRPPYAFEEYGAGTECVRIAFVNNMPDAALEDTEVQFFDLLDSASSDIPVRLSLHSLSGVPRGERGEQHLSRFYFSTGDLLNGRFDALIMTGTEPRQPDLRSEPYWSSMTTVLDWAESNTASTILSCLAAHAGVLHTDGIQRHRLSDKQFGVFDFAKAANHRLTAAMEDRIRFPHSRWNAVQANELKACGYLVLSHSAEGGVDSFLKIKKRSLFLHFQGHPEYGERTLMKEYRRDIKRFLMKERETYPSMPKGYFDAASAAVLNEFRGVVLSDRREELMERFPESAVNGSLQNTWRSCATSIYRNWLQYVVSKKTEVAAFPAMAAALHQSLRKRSARP